MGGGSGEDAALQSAEERVARVKQMQPEPEPEPEPTPAFELELSPAHRTFDSSPLEPDALRSLAQEAQRMELWHLASTEIVATRDAVAAQLQLASDMLRSFRVHSKVPEPDDEGRIFAVGGTPLVKIDHEVPHGSIKGGCIVKGGAVVGAEFKMRLNRVKKSSVQVLIKPEEAAPSPRPGAAPPPEPNAAVAWRLEQLTNAQNYVLDAASGAALQGIVGWDSAAAIAAQGGGAVPLDFVEQSCDALHRTLVGLHQASAALEAPPIAGPQGLAAAQTLFDPPLPPGILVEFGIRGASFVVSGATHDLKHSSF